MHIGITVKDSPFHPNAQHLVIQVDDNLLYELEQIFTIRNAEEESNIHQFEIEREEKKTNNIDVDAKYIIHFICDMRCNTLELLSEAIRMYSSYFIKMHISLSSQIDISGPNSNQLRLNVLTNHNTNPQQISLYINHLKNIILSKQLSLQSFHLYVNIVSDIYNFVYCQLMQLMHDKLFPSFMQFNPTKQSLSFILALSEESITNLNSNNRNNSNNYWNNINAFLSHSCYLNDMELVVKTQSSLYTQSNSHGFIFNQLLHNLKCNKNINSMHSLKLTCWGFLNKCNLKIQKLFGEHMKYIIVNTNITKLWLRYAGMNELILNDVFDGIQNNENFTDLRIQRMLLNEKGNILSKLGEIVNEHIGIESVEIGWNMASIPNIKYYMDLLNGITNNRCNLKKIEIYADNQYKLKVLEILLNKNIILENIKLHLIDWNENDKMDKNNDEIDDTHLMKICSKMVDVMIENQMYLQLQSNSIKKNLQNICEFPNGLILNVLSYVYPNKNVKYHLSVEVVMNYESDDTYNFIMNSFNNKKAILNKQMDENTVKRCLEFKISKPWPG